MSCQQLSNVSTFQFSNSLSIRALEVLNDSTVWFAANNGVYGYTEDNGKTWNVDSIQYDTIHPEFRSIAVLDQNTVLLLSIASPGLLYRTTDKGKNWELVFKDTSQYAFYDSMKFWDKQNGMAIGDPVDGKIQIINTRDGGKTWKKVEHKSLPLLQEGEAFFAASNTCFDLFQNHTWIATGGKNTRVIYSPNGGKNHLSQDPKMPFGEDMTGIYSIDFFNSRIGVVVGGDYNEADNSITVLSYTYDCGKTWYPKKFKKELFGSCVQFLDKDRVVITGKPGTFIYDIKHDELNEILDKNESIGMHTLRISPDKKTIWLAGGNGTVLRIE